MVGYVNDDRTEHSVVKCYEIYNTVMINISLPMRDIPKQ